MDLMFLFLVIFPKFQDRKSIKPQHWKFREQEIGSERRMTGNAENEEEQEIQSTGWQYKFCCWGRGDIPPL